MSETERSSKTPNEERLERELAVQKRITQAAINSNAHWDDVSQFLVWDRPADQYDGPISEAHMASALATYPQFADDIRDFVRRWNAEPRLTDEILDAVEIKPEDLERGTRRTVQILDFYRKLRKVEDERDALKRELAELRKQFEAHQAADRSINEALNSGDGSYRP